MTLHPNRPGGLRGDDGSTLQQLKAQLVALNATMGSLLTAVQQQGTAQGTPALTDCNLSQLELLCSIHTLLGGGPGGEAPEEPAFRCGGLFLGGYWLGDSWISSLGSRINAANVFYPNWGTEFDSPDATIVSLTLEGDSGPFPTLIPGIVPRTVCVSAYVGEGVQFFGVDRYTAADQEYHSTSIIGAVDWSDPWTAGQTFNVDPAYVYRFHLVMPEEATSPATGTYLFYTEGSLG
jgi:hypothetical protein